MEFNVLDPKSRKPVAQVHLNGYNIEPGGPLGQGGAMRSFTLLQGTVHNFWYLQQPLILQRGDGREATVRIAALPAEAGETGFIEFL